MNTVINYSKMKQQHIDKFISRKNKILYIVGVMSSEATFISSIISRKIGSTSIVNLDSFIEANRSKFTSEISKDLITKHYLNELSKHHQVIVEGVTVMDIPTITNKDSIVLISEDVEYWIHKLKEENYHTVIEYLKKQGSVSKLLETFINKHQLTEVNKISQMFLSERGTSDD